MNFFKNIKLSILTASLLFGIGCNIWAESIPSPVTVDFEGLGFADNTDYGSATFTSGDFTITYSAGNFSTYSTYGSSNSAGLYPALYSSGLETITIQTTSGKEFNFQSFFENGFSGAVMHKVDGYLDGGSTPTATKTTGFSTGNDVGVTVTLGSAFENVDKVVLTANSGFFHVIDQFVFGVAVVPNTAPTLGGTFTTAGTVNDNATTTPFSGVTVADAESDPVSIAITYTGANGTLTGTGITGSAGSYTMTSAALATVQSNLQGLVFHPTENQVAPASTVVTTFTLTPNDGTTNGSANATTVITTTSVNDTPTNISLSNATVNQSGGTNATVGTLSVTDADTGDGATYTLVSGTGDTNNTSFNISGTTLRANNATALSAGTYSVRVNVNDGDADFAKAFTITVVDNVAPTASTLSPTLNATNVGLSGDIVVTFSENIAKGTGNIYIKAYSNDAVLQTIDVTSVAVVVSGTTATISHSTPFALNTQYYVTVDATAFDDTTGNSFAGISSKDTWKFTSVNNQTPTIGGITTTTTINDNVTTTPFSSVTITDSESDNVTVTVTLDTAAKGVFTTDSLSASGFSNNGNGSYSLASTTPANGQIAIRQLVFNPADNRVAVGDTEVTTFTITVNDGNSNGTNNTTTVTSTSIDDAPVASSMAATVGPNSQNTFDTFAPSSSDADGDNPIVLKIETLPTVGTFETNTTSGDGSWTTITTAPFEVAMSDTANYRFNAGNNSGLQVQM
jgi:fibronectin-binding autotransporter adhesin